MLNPDQQALVDFVQKEAVHLPLAQRLMVYRGLADFSDMQDLVSAMTRKVRILERAEAECREQDLNFTKDKGHNGGK